MLRVRFTANIMTGLIGELRNGCYVLLGIRREFSEVFVEGCNGFIKKLCNLKIKSFKKFYNDNT